MEIKYPLSPYTSLDAYHLVDNFLDRLVYQHRELIANPVKEWNNQKDLMDFSFTAKGFDIKGNIKINEGNLVLNGQLPFAAKLFRSKIERLIKENLDGLFIK